MLCNYRMYAANQEVIERAVYDREVLLRCARVALTLTKDEVARAFLSEAIDYAENAESRRAFADAPWPPPGYPMHGNDKFRDRVPLWERLKDRLRWH